MVIMYSQLTQEVRIVLHSQTHEHIAYQITTTDGQLIRKGKLTPGANSYNVSTKGLPSGKYLFTTENCTQPFEKRGMFDS
ncbi:MAG: hypothetical protein J0L80_05395 [Chitinophagales bacterium]|nr:hypothetical protein [Chitinophagales bacterium]